MPCLKPELLNRKTREKRALPPQMPHTHNKLFYKSVKIPDTSPSELLNSQHESTLSFLFKVRKLLRSIHTELYMLVSTVRRGGGEPVAVSWGLNGLKSSACPICRQQSLQTDQSWGTTCCSSPLHTHTHTH